MRKTDDDQEHINEIRRLIGYDDEDENREPKLLLIKGGLKSGQSPTEKRR